MSFLFALLQLTTFSAIDDEATFEAESRPGIEAAPTRSELLQRPIVTPCAGNGCR